MSNRTENPLSPSSSSSTNCPGRRNIQDGVEKSHVGTSTGFSYWLTSFSSKFLSCKTLYTDKTARKSSPHKERPVSFSTVYITGDSVQRETVGSLWLQQALQALKEGDSSQNKGLGKREYLLMAELT
ncbi:hypothetical protein RRG08_020839 [Elysia crispata]|uniref:Uncharacterized protein n=1 Tax=Elysia crispata TaxID=231223 RepID=A0AAE0XUZ2_9GAST|nr:hypothetical protein RRG08_020839 [Elysia crispata]